MMASKSGRNGILWAVLGGSVLILGIVAIIISSIASQPSTSPTAGHSSTGTTSSQPPQSEAPAQVVDPSAVERGWRPEPITTDAETYIRAALEAASTFDTQKSTRDEWLSYLDGWFTPDTRYESESDQVAVMEQSKVEMRQGVVLPQEQWDSLAREQGRVVATVTGDIAFVPVSDDASGDMAIGTADVTLTFTRSDDAGGETTYDETVRVSVQVLCGPDSVPTPNTAQRAGDCKVVRYFTEPLEP